MTKPLIVSIPHALGKAEATRRLRKRKRVAELAEIRRVADVTASAFRAVASRLAHAVEQVIRHERRGTVWRATGVAVIGA